MNNPMYFELQADDLERAIKFYQTVFGWKFDKLPWTQVEYYRIETDGLSGGLLKRHSKAPSSGSGTNAAVVSMEVKNYDQTEKEILASGGTIALPKFAVPGRCWQGYYVDTEDNTFGILEVDPNAG